MDPGTGQPLLRGRGQEALPAHAGTAGHARQDPRPQRPGAGHQPAGQGHLGRARGRAQHRARRRHAEARQAARHEQQGSGGQAGRGQGLRLPEAPGAAGHCRPDRRPEDRRHLSDARIQALLPGRRSDGAHRRLHQRRGQGPGRHGVGARAGSRGRVRPAPGDQGSPGPRGGGRRRAEGAARGPRPDALHRRQDPVPDLQRAQGGRGAQPCQGRQRHRARRPDRRGAGAGQLSDLQPERPLAPVGRTAAQPRADRHLRARLDDEADQHRPRAAAAPRDAQHAGADQRQVHAGRRDHLRHQQLRHADRRPGHPALEQYRHDQDRADAQAAGNVGHVHQRRLRPGAQDRLPGRGGGAAAPGQELAAHRAGDHVVRLRPVGVAVPDGACLHDLRARRRTDPGHDVPHQRPAAAGGARAVVRGGAAGAPDAGNRDIARRHRAAGAGDGLPRGRQDRHGVQARRPRI